MRRRRFRIPTLVAVLSFQVLPAAATTQTDVKVAAVGTHEGQVYLKLADPLADSCLHGVLYAPLASGFAEYVMSIALSARTTGAALGLISYTKSAAGTCTIDMIEI